ncbi:hypothetical protein CTAYLR_010334 [Chrysophaeum taylorii]|uniref:DNA-directed RNA polymerase subunit n=1 Tax=Chrysophaeum taylorii TaxID=2483200 RepID=A0AAD7XL36_9STRA|nr:hypothetical protein CTAYLR_010334 [Chrysophaeum taylorii]
MSSAMSEHPRRIRKIQFGILSPDEIRNMSVTQKTNARERAVEAGITKYETWVNGQGVYGGVNDPRMGDLSDKDDPGHFGHIELARPVYHLGFLKTAITVLRCVCFHCSKVLGRSDEDARVRNAQKLQGQRRLEAMHKLCRTITKCDEETGCGGLQPKYKKKGSIGVEALFHEDDEAVAGDRKQSLSAAKAHEILQRISDDDVRRLGLNPEFARPDWFLVTVLPVPPPQVRPSVQVNDSARSEDDLTHQYVSVVKANRTLEELTRSGEAPHIIERYEELLQYAVNALFDNEAFVKDGVQATQRSGKPLKTFRQRLKSKEGRLRGNLMGKRVDFSARTVITADPNLSIDQVGVPRSIAKTLTVPERVAPFNVRALAELVRNGPDVWPGARFVIHADGRRVDLRFVKHLNDLALHPGFVVERHVRDDDVIVFNRQPSLHKMSIMGHRVKVLDHSTFRLNLSVTTPYNADFDGDEMNLHAPQSVAARAEVENLLMVHKNIVSPQSNKPVMGIVQDSLLACARITSRDTFVEKDLLFNLIMWTEWDGTIPTPAILKPKPLWTGKQVFSMVLPTTNYVGKSYRKNTADNDADGSVTVVSGVLVEGVLDKKALGTSAGGLVHTIWLEKGPEVARDFLNRAQCLVNQWMVNTSFSVGIGDTVADQETMRAIEKTIDEAKQKVKRLVQQGQQGELPTQPGRTVIESFEVFVNKVLNDTRQHAGLKVQDAISEKNNIKAMAVAGSKGNDINISQIIACVGQQNVEGKRIPYGFKRRTLPHFAKDDLGPESRGFVENSYLRGLSPQEFFFHAMGGREGLIDTACKTATVGYLQRRLVKSMESVMVRYDGTVRTNKGNVIQFLYGEDGVDGAWVEGQNLKLLLLDDTELRHYYSIFDLFFDEDPLLGGEAKNLRVRRGPKILFVCDDRAVGLDDTILSECQADPNMAALLEDELDQLKRDRDALRHIFAYREVSVKKADAFAQLPVNLDRLVWAAQRQFDCGPRLEIAVLDPRVALAGVGKLCSAIRKAKNPSLVGRENDNEDATLLFCILVRSRLACRRCVFDYRLTPSAFEWLMGEIETRFAGARVHSGEMCGVLAAQSIGQPATQMTLNTFHFAGVSAKNVTLGVPRLNEILNVTKSVKTPSLTIYLQNGGDEEVAREVQAHLEFATLGTVALLTQIVYDPDSNAVEDDRDVVEAYEMAPDEDYDPKAMSPWVLRVELDKEKIADKKLPMAAIAEAIRLEWGEDLHVIYSDDNADKLVLRIRIKTNNPAESNNNTTNDDDDDDDDDEWPFLRRVERAMLAELKLRGIEGVTKVYVKEEKRVAWDDRGALREVDEWVLETDGTNLAAVLSYPNVDHTRTVSNDIVEIFSVLGIEGTRCALLHFVREVLSFDNGYVNYRHLAVLCDTMCFRGTLMAISRHGINRGDAGPLLSASFEETVEILYKAAIFSQSDHLDGVTQNIMLGQLGVLGTGACDLLLDAAELENAVDLGGYADLPEATTKDDEDGFQPQTPYASTPTVPSPDINGGASPTPNWGDLEFSPSQPLLRFAGLQSNVSRL